MKIAYSDPPYIGCAHLYKEHPDFAGEVDHVALVDRLQSEYDGWVLHAGAHNVSEEILAPMMARLGARKCVWVKQFAAFKRNVPVAYAWEPVYIKAARKPVVSKRLVMRDWIMCPITMKKGLTGAKPEAVVHWAENECLMDAAWDCLPGESWRPLHMAEFYRVKSDQAMKALEEFAAPQGKRT